ncbi:MAG: metalloregulator ArsR/SmtB family transcription factor [Alphaproteobacteria bacterium]|nr:metalloregulator ArsR/SmtB family transcription factor [Alphaproteobacteria bacterium]
MPASTLKADQVFNALGDPTRRAIVEQLSRGPSTVSRLAEPLDITLTAVRQHLHVLEGCKLVSTRKVGRTRTCQLEKKGLAVIEDWIHAQRSMWDSALDNLGALLEEDGEP